MHDGGGLGSSSAFLSFDPPDRSGGRAGESGAENLRGGRRIKHRDLANLLNAAHFREGGVYVRFERPDCGTGFFLKALPEPSDGQTLSCRWAAKGPGPEKLAEYSCTSILISDGRVHASVPAEATSVDEAGIRVRLPQPGVQESVRAQERYVCEGVRARILQSGVTWEGTLEDFNGVSLGVTLDDGSSPSRNWLNPAQPVTLLLFRDGELLFSGECSVLKKAPGPPGARLALFPSRSNLQRYPPRKHRSHRQELSPSPTVRFVHPLSGRTEYLRAENLSGMGVCVEEFFERSSLIPGLIIEDLSVELAGSVLAACRAQVLYVNLLEKPDGRRTARCGLVFLDLEARDQVRLSSAVHSAIDGRLSVCGPVEMDELWSFFFESGFIYPSKYLSLQAHKDEFCRTYRKLYEDSPTIARHFFFRDKGRIFGHMSMLRFYPDSWLIQHHAASRDGYGGAGVSVLDEAGRFTNDFHLHPRARMDYLMCYFRPENRFPARVFGNAAKDIADPKGSSVDTFAYLSLPELEGAAAEGFQLFPARPADLQELGRWYESRSGGLTLDALALRRLDGSDAELSGEYRREGFRRERQVFSLRSGGALAAVIQVTVSDLGLNLSNLTSCMHVLVLDSERLSAAALFSALDALRGAYPDGHPPVLVYPREYLGRYSVPYEKTYALWVLNTAYSDAYFESVRDTFRRSCREQEERRAGSD